MNAPANTTQTLEPRPLYRYRHGGTPDRFKIRHFAGVGEALWVGSQL